MLFQRINRSDAETVFTIVFNISAATVTAGYPVVWDITSPDGVSVSKPAGATLSCLVGIAVSDIANSAYGKVQVYGYKASANVVNNVTTAIAAGNLLIPVDASWNLAYGAASDGKSGLIYAAESYATATTTLLAAASKKIFIRCL
jgi:hypothetical protein